MNYYQMICLVFIICDPFSCMFEPHDLGSYYYIMSRIYKLKFWSGLCLDLDFIN